MSRTKGRSVRLSTARKMVGDFLFAGKQLTLTTIEKRMRLADIVTARAAALPKPSWVALFTKALGAVTARHPELRRVYLPWPWPRLFEYDENLATVVIERNWQNEPALFLAFIAQPERMTALEIDRSIRHFKEAPIEEFFAFRSALRFARLPHCLRRFVMWLVMNWMPRLRSTMMGTFGVTVTASLGATGLFIIAPWTLGLHYDIFDADGSLEVRLTFDHRVIDGAILAAALAEVERELLGPISEELRATQMENSSPFSSSEIRSER